MDAWRWQVTLWDGTVIDEYEPSGQARGWATVANDQVERIALFPQQSPEALVYVLIPPGARARFWRRRTITLHPDGQQTTHTVTILGWDGAGHEALLWLDDEGGIRMTAGDDAS